MIPFLKPHIESNAAAVAFLHAGDTSAAISTLKTTLQSVRFSQTFSTWKAGCSSFPTSDKKEDTLPNYPRLLRTPQLPTVRSVPVRCAEARDNHFSFYCKAFVIEETCDNQVDVGTLVFVLLYNLALAMHTLCVDGKRQDLVQIVLQQYRHSLMVLDDCCNTPTQGNLAFVQLAAVNNIGFIFSQHQYVLQSQEAMEWMHSMIHSVWEIVPDEDDAFFTVSMCMNLASFANAPAA